MLLKKRPIDQLYSSAQEEQEEFKELDIDDCALEQLQLHEQQFLNSQRNSQSDHYAQIQSLNGEISTIRKHLHTLTHENLQLRHQFSQNTLQKSLIEHNQEWQKKYDTLKTELLFKVIILSKFLHAP